MMRGREIALGLAVLGGGLAILTIVIPQEIRAVTSQAGQVSPAFFPRIVAWLFIILGAAHVLQHLLSSPAANDKEAVSGGTTGTLRALAVLGIGVVYVIALPKLGFLVATALGLLALILFLGGGRPWRAIAFAVLFAWLLQELFGRVLRIPLPRAGWLE